MSFAHFITGLLSLTVIFFSVACGLYYFGLSRLSVLYAFIAAVFFLFNLSVFIISTYTVSTYKYNSFFGIVSAGFLIKLVLAIAFMFSWPRFMANTVSSDVLHFLLIYVCYTIHEVYFLTKVGKA